MARRCRRPSPSGRRVRPDGALAALPTEGRRAGRRAGQTAGEGGGQVGLLNPLSPQYGIPTPYFHAHALRSFGSTLAVLRLTDRVRHLLDDPGRDGLLEDLENALLLEVADPPEGVVLISRRVYRTHLLRLR